MAASIREIEAAIKSPDFSHARRGDGCWRDLVWIYHRNPRSPSGVTVACGAEASIADPLIRLHQRTSALSPSER